MSAENDVRLEAQGRAMSVGVLAYGAAGGIAGTWLVILIGFPVVSLFPEAIAFSWLMFLPISLSVILFVLYFLQYLISVHFEPGHVSVYWLGIRVQTIPASELRLFCAVGNGREDVLCLTSRSIEEMALLYERKLLRGFLTRSEVPFRKRKADWQGEFVKGFVNDLRKSPIGMLKQRGTVMVEMKPELQYLLRKMHPQIPYRNYTGVASYYATRNGQSKDDHTIVILSPHWDHSVALETDGLHISTRKGEKLHIPSQEIKTIVRVDAFINWHRHYPHHLPLVFISCLPEEDLIYIAPKIAWDSIDESEPNRQSLLAMVAASKMVWRDAPPCKECCMMHFTENTIRKIRELYPHARFNDISACWLDDADAVTS